MDGDNLERVQDLARRGSGRAHVGLLRDFEPGAPAGAEVPDPYFGGERGFEEVQDMVERACRGLLEHIEAEHRDARRAAAE